MFKKIIGWIIVLCLFTIVIIFLSPTLGFIKTIIALVSTVVFVTLALTAIDLILGEY